MSAPSLEGFLARLYTDASLRRRFLAQPEAIARQAGFDEQTVRALVDIDREGLVLAAQSIARKHAAHAGKIRSSWLRRLGSRVGVRNR
jgi:hypothetical protein